PRTQLHGFLDGVLRDIARAGDRNLQTFERTAGLLEHFLGEIHRTVAGRFGTDQRTTEAQALARKHAVGAVRQFLHHAGHIADFALAHADVAGRHVGVGADMAEQLAHESLAEAHHFARALALGIEIRTALAAAHGQRGERVLQGLFEGQELKDRQVHRRVKADAALVGADGGVVLNAIAAVDPHFALIVHPGDTELYRPLRLDQSVQQPVFRIARVGLDERPDAAYDFTHRLQKFRFSGIARGNDVQKLVRALILQHARLPLNG